MAITGSVYCLIDSAGSIIYVGATKRTVRQRYREHRRNTLVRRTNIARKMLELGVDNVQAMCVHTQEFSDEREMKHMEQYFFDFFRNVGVHLYNQFNPIEDVPPEERARKEEKAWCEFCEVSYMRYSPSSHMKTKRHQDIMAELLE